MDCLGSVGFPSGAAATQGSGIASMGFGGPSMTGINVFYSPPRNWRYTVAVTLLIQFVVFLVVLVLLIYGESCKFNFKLMLSGKYKLFLRICVLINENQQFRLSFTKLPLGTLIEISHIR